MKLRVFSIAGIGFVILAGPAACNEIAGIEPPIIGGDTSTGTGTGTGTDTNQGPCDGVAAGDTVPCYTGPAETLDIGLCHGGVQACDEKGELTGECMGEVLPAKEVCGDGDDDDCNGLVDDDCSVCGDGIVSGKEECDGTDLCTSDCLFLRVAQISAGHDHTCAVLNDGRVKCWGRNDTGQLGLGDSQQRGDKPDQMGALLPAVDLGENGARALAVGAGYVHTCALLETGDVKCWGDNNVGQLGFDNGKQQIADAPGEMGDNLAPVLLGGKAVAIAVGDYHNCALLEDGTTQCWGANFGGELGLASGQGSFNSPQTLVLADKPLVIDAGHDDTCIAFEDGRVKCFGENDNGQLGLGDSSDRCDSASETVDSLPFVNVGMHVITKLALGGYTQTTTNPDGTTSSSFRGHACALAVGGDVLCWGNNSSGQLGLGLPNNQNWGNTSTETVMQVIPGLTAIAIAAGDEHSCALPVAGGAVCWGSNADGQLGLADDKVNQNDVSTPLPVALPDTFVAITAGERHTCALLAAGTVKCWGRNDHGQLGLGDNQHRGDNPGEMAVLPEVQVF